MSVWWCEKTTEFICKIIWLFNPWVETLWPTDLAVRTLPVTTSSCGPFRLAGCRYVAILTALDGEAIEPRSPTRERERAASTCRCCCTFRGRVDTVTISCGASLSLLLVGILAPNSWYESICNSAHVTSHGYSQDKLWGQTCWLDGTSCCVGHEWPWVWGLKGWHGWQVRKWIWIRLCI